MALQCTLGFMYYVTFSYCEINVCTGIALCGTPAAAAAGSAVQWSGRGRGC